MTDHYREEREALIRAVQAVTWNASNYPTKVQPHILGQDVVPLTLKIVDAVQAVFEQAHAVQDAEEPEWVTERAVEILDAGGWGRTTWESIGDARRMFPAAKFREITRQVKAGPWEPVEQGDAS